MDVSCRNDTNNYTQCQAVASLTSNCNCGNIPLMEITVSIDRVFVHPDNLDIRGPNPSLTGLKDSLEQDGQGYAMYATVGADGNYYVYEGGRRLAALSALGVTEVVLSVSDISPAQVLRMIAVSNIKEPFPPVVARDGCAVGGKALLVRRMLDEGMQRHEIAASLDERIDIVSAYISLLDEEPAVLDAVASGRLEMTAYARIKYKSPDFKRQIIEGAKGKKVPVRAVLKAIQDDNAGAIDEMVKEAQPRNDMGDNPVGAILARLRGDLMTLRNMDVDLSRFEIWDDICELWEEVA